ncbi:hypothetical protein OIU78_017633 [Salix suchowensis]|nr:hypothetical protein OIU78_017633 [Salix suchowensis]
MKALQDDNVNMIGLYGMGGVGKTTLVKEVGRRAKETQLFDEVLFATVSQNPNVMYIQDRMAKSLGLQFDVKTKEGRADLLWQGLKTEKKMLLILDDVWKVVNLKEIGIPFGDDHRGCKVLLTTRDRDICSLMQCQQKVFLSILSENEAWALFKIKAGLRDEDSNLNTVAKEVARECQGLPIALVTVGRALRGKSVDEWEFASTKLKNSEFQHMEQIGEEKNTYACLKLSYDYLKHEKTKLCFLLCCLFPEDYNIPIEDLTRYAVGYGLHQDVESIEDARKQVHVAIKTLKDCCMLLGTGTEEFVKMHQLVRDVAIQIASSKEHGFMVKAGIGLKELPMSNKSFERCKTISLMGNKLAELPEGLTFPQLKVLLLELDSDLNVPARFFEGMTEIEVLSLEGGCLSLQSLEFSTNLQSLLLIRCKCNDLIWLRKLQRLKILGFIWCSSVEELPDEIGELKELRLLDVTGCYRLGRIPVNLIGRLKKLEELLISYNSFEGWGVVGCDSTGGMNASLTELNLLSHLTVLSLKIPRVECIPRDFVFPRLLKYDIMLGNGGYLTTEHPTSTRLLYLSDISAASLIAKTFEQLFPTVSQICFIDVDGLENIALSSDQMTSHGHGSQKDFFQSLEDVEVKRCRDIHTLFPAKWRQALNNLTSVEIENCESLEEVFELGEAEDGINEEQELRQLSSLTRLELTLLPELKCIWKGPTRHVSLRSLIHLELRSLDKLTFIFTPHLAQSLVHLETLRINYCRGLKHLISEKDDESEIIPESLGFPKLKTLSISDCDQLEYVFPVSVSPSLWNLEEMKILCCANLKQIFYSGEGDALTIDGIINIPQLRKLWLSSGCNFFGPKNFTAQFPSLELLSINGHEELGDLLAQLQGHTNLKKITIKDIESLPSKVFTPSESSKEAFEQIMKALKDDNVNMIGLYGMGGVGKTTLVKEVGRRAKETQLFDEVLLATVSQNPNVMYMQDRMAESLGLRFDEKTKEGRANRLWQGLKKKKKLLVILDDVWQDVDLEEIGIPFGDDHRGCKVLLATRGLRDEDCNLNTVAKKVARECQGLLIALVTVGRALRDKSTVEWEVASKELKNSQFKLIEDYNIPIEDLTRYTVGYGLHQDVESIEDARKQVYVAIKTLKDCCMLLGTESEKYVKMHDMVRDVAIQIASSKEHGFMVKAGIGLKEWPMSNKSFEGCTTISLMGNKLAQLPEGLVCPQLKVLLLELDNDLKVPERFFEGMKGIEVLSLKGGCLSLQSLEFSTNLQSLLLIHCKCKDDESEIIPDSLGFPKLKTLSIRCCDELEFVFPVSVSPCLLNLEEMEIEFCANLKQIFYRGEGDALTRDGIINFPQLRKLSLSSCCFFGPKNFTAQLPSLQVLYIEEHEELGDLLAQFQGHTNLREIHITDCEGAQEIIQVGSFVTNKRTGQEFSLLSLKKLDLSFLPDMRCIWKGLVLSHLTILEVCYCQKLTHVFTSSMVASLVQLQFLAISACEELEQIIAKDNDDEKDEILSGSDLQSLCFPNLCKVEIKGCNKLRSLFPVAMASGLPKLETLDVSHSSQLLGVFGQDDDASLVNVEKKMVFPKLSFLRLYNLSSIIVLQSWM